MLHPVPHEYGPEPPIVELKDVSCGYDGRVVLRDVNLSIMPGDFVGLLGPSGSGKSTLLPQSRRGRRPVPRRGDCGGAVGGEKTAKDRLRSSAGDHRLDFPVTAWEVVMMGCTADSPAFPWYGKGERKRGLDIMERLGIAGLAGRHIRELSGGEQQRTFLARALVSNPRLLILDEPTSGVDIKTRDDMMHLLDELNHQDITVIISTHEITPWPLICRASCA